MILFVLLKRVGLEGLKLPLFLTTNEVSCLRELLEMIFRLNSINSMGMYYVYTDIPYT
jgi:hypothetical protein